MSFVSLLSGFVRLAALCQNLGFLDNNCRRRASSGVSALISVGNDVFVTSVVGPGDWRESTRLKRVTSVVCCTWVL